MKKSISIGEVAEILGVCVTTLRIWNKEKRLVPAFRTKGGHRRYLLKDILNLIHKNKTEKRINVGYARVSSHDQKEDLKRQTKTLEKELEVQNNSYQIIEDLGSGLNFKKRGLKTLINLIISSKINKIWQNP